MHTDRYNDFEDAESEIKYWKEVIGISAIDGFAVRQPNEILNNEDTDNESEESENEEDAERNPMTTVDKDDNAYDVGSPKNLGPFDTADLAIKELEDFAKNTQFSIRILSSNYDKKTNKKKDATVACIHFGKLVLKKYVPKSDQLDHRNTESQRCDCKKFSIVWEAFN
ncbi:hypothetical protein [Parasitella parasitica]|uniref:FAR1 domain-containing protein n=1 Tax=Parasitella parasitica TaxID=35722 RepID=A0A0B7NEX8_9FUNG|nr:hypothetical protein [Parasitella parasitica]